MTPTHAPAGRAADGGHESQAERQARFERDVVAYRPTLLATARNLTRNAADAEDLVQETLARAYASYDRYGPGASFGAWARRILLNHYIDGYRKGKCRPRQCSIEEIGEHLALQAQSGHPSLRSPEATVIDRLTVQDVMVALRKVPPLQRTAVYLADVEGFAYKEVADLMGTPIGTVMSRVHRGRKRLRGLLASYAPEGCEGPAGRPVAGESSITDGTHRPLAPRVA